MVSMSSRMVEIADFPSVSLSNTRSLYVYLPPSYHENTEKHYAVLYMHDGQHVFSSDERGGSWDMHVTADRLVSEGRMEEIIVVGIATVPHQRLNEYFHDNPRMHQVFDPPFAGERYETFIIEEVMPYINQNFRTLRGPEHTAMMGSSAGGSSPTTSVSGGRMCSVALRSCRLISLKPTSMNGASSTSIPFMKDTVRTRIFGFGWIWAVRKEFSWKNTPGRKRNAWCRTVLCQGRSHAVPGSGSGSQPKRLGRQSAGATAVFLETSVNRSRSSCMATTSQGNRSRQATESGHYIRQRICSNIDEWSISC